MGQQRIKLYQGAESDCSYLENRTATNIYADPHHPQLEVVYGDLVALGFRRSGEYVYKPGCNNCNACVPIRILADEFEPRRLDRRNLKQNSDLEVNCVKAVFNQEYFDLYSRYLAHRHKGGGMDHPGAEDFKRFLLNPWGDTLFVEARSEGRCVAVAVTDVTARGLSAVYTYFEPGFDHRSLGRFCILQQLELCRKLDLQHLYLGYWIEECRKMQYKNEYKPYEMYRGQTWIRSDAGQVSMHRAHTADFAGETAT